MKIAFFTETYLPNIDGVVISILNTKKELERLGHEVLIFAAGSRKDKKENKDPKVYFYTSLPFLPYPDYKFALLPYTAERIVRKERVDVIHSHGMGAMGMAALWCSMRTKKPVVGTIHTNIQEATHYVAPAGREIMKRIAWRYLRFYFNRCDLTMAPSKFMEKICREKGIRNVVFVPNGIDLKKYRPSKKRKNGENRILYVGRLVKEKNLDVVIKSSLLVAEKIKRAKFLIAGKGPAEEYYKNLVRREGVSHLFEFLGLVPFEKIIEIYNSADVFIFPSVFETQGIAAIEAMACGLPVAGARYLAIPDIVEEKKNGYLFDPYDVDGCASAIVKCFEEKNKLRRGALETAKRFSIENCTKELLSVYEEISNRRM